MDGVEDDGIENAESFGLDVPLWQAARTWLPDARWRKPELYHQAERDQSDTYVRRRIENIEWILLNLHN